MGLHNLLNRLKHGASDSPNTSEESTGYQAKPSTGEGCTLDTPDTSQIDGTRESAANDDGAPWRVSVAPGTPPDVLARLRAASLALDRKQASLPIEPPDSCCWPHSSAMNGAEINTFMARVKLFTDQGLSLDEAEHLADKQVIRDRESDSRRSCLECAHLRQAGGWRCGNWHQAGVATRAKDAQLPEALVQLLQRCDGYKSSS
jgi:hypothetical protein